MLCPGNEVHALVRAIPASVRHGVSYHTVDLSAEWSTDTLPSRIDAVVHLAQSRRFREFPEQSVETFRINVASTATLLDYAWRAGATRFILASTGGLYSPAASVIGEHSPINPPDGPLAFYFRSKLAAELLAQPYMALMDVSVLRPFFIYGPGQAADKLIARLASSVREGLPIQLNGWNGLTINPVFIDDVADLLRVIIDSPGSRTLSVAGPDSVSIREIAEAIGQEVGRAPVFEQREGNEDMLIADHRTMERLLGRSLTGFVEGVRRTFR